jgi:hypothetical protein
MIRLAATIERVAELAAQADHIQKTMTMPRTGEPLAYERAEQLLRVAFEAIELSTKQILETL